ncbi:NACHT domain-containing protein [Streptomyces sp. NPDC057617]|uniref:NACHT domain-containing protein n=1 Tax=Streptomyces sp. NPDC057617 TaxID=3346184 RepID=UPI0036939388
MRGRGSLPGGLHNVVTGGRQETLVQVGYLERLTVYIGVGSRGLLVVLGLVLLLSQPALPLPARFAVAPAHAGWALLVVVLFWELTGRAFAARQRRREAAWSAPEALNRSADKLAEALLHRYRDDERLRQADNPQSIDVLWTEVGASDGGPTAEAGAAGQPVSLAAYFGRTPGRRLVVLGAAGAGKSVLAVRLARDLLEKRRGTPRDAQPEPVPVVLQLASWDSGQGLDTWSAGQLAADHPEACRPVPGASAEAVARHLVNSGRVLLVLDGFDELPEANRAAAFDELKAMHNTRPFVLTSRPEQYGQQVPADSDFLRTEITLLQLTPAAIGEYLTAGGRRARWRNLVAKLVDTDNRTREVVLLRRALDVPLMVGLARVAYGQEDTHPDELVEPGRFHSAAEIQQYLYTVYLDAVYSSSRSERALHGGSSPEKARKWAGFLAARMKAADRTEFSWWTLDREVPAPVRMVGLLPAFVLAWLLVSRFDFGKPWWGDVVPLSVRGGFTVLAVLALCAGGVSQARRQAEWQHAPHSVGMLSGDGLRAALRRVRWKAGPMAFGLVAGWVAALAGGAAFGHWAMVVATAVVLWVCVRWLVSHTWRPTDTALAESPAGMLARDRRSALALGWLGPLRPWREGDPLGYLVLPSVMLAGWYLQLGQEQVSTADWVVVGGGTLLCWQLHAVAVSAWGRFTVARLWFALCGQLPLRLLDFLEDAHRRGVLRQSGGIYQFRHIELRNRLAADTHVPDGHGSPAGRPGSVVNMVVAGGLWLVVTAGAVALATGAAGAEPGPWPVRSVPAPCSLLGERELAQLTSDGMQHAHSGEPGQVPAVVRHCSAAEQSPFAPDVQIHLGTYLYTTDTTRGGKSWATKEFGEAAPKGAEERKEAGFQALDGLGDEAYLTVARDPQAGTFMEPYPDPWRATVVVRQENALLSLSYVEEFATKGRTAEVARILARQAAEHAGPGWTTGTAAGATASLDDIPKTRVPDKDNRFAYYRRDWHEKVRGATWKGRERSHLRQLPGIPFVFRAPKQLACGYGGSEEDDKVDELTVHECKPREEAQDMGISMPDVRIDIASLYCGSSCSDKESELVLRGDRKSRSAGLDWTTADHSSSYAERTGGKAGGRYEMLLWRSFGWRSDDGKAHLFLLWARVETSAKEKELAQKIVNDVFTQTGGNRRIDD